MSNALAVIDQAKGGFLAVLPDNKVWSAEAGFATQLLSGNKFLYDTATKNSQSAIDAIVNVSALGVSLNPAKKEAYLVPRDGKVVLDISYIGLINLAIREGGIKWADAKMVYEKDKFEIKGVDEKPIHEYLPFGDRGKVIGAYAICKTHDGSYLTCAMSISEINAIRDKCSKAKSGSAPWIQFYEQMCLKTVIKRAVKLWPKCDATLKAVDYLNTVAGEGIDFKQPDASVAMISVKTLDDINDELKRVGRTMDAFLSWFTKSVIKRDVIDISELTQKEGEQALNTLRSIKSETL